MYAVIVESCVAVYMVSLLRHHYRGYTYETPHGVRSGCLALTRDAQDVDSNGCPPPTTEPF